MNTAFGPRERLRSKSMAARMEVSERTFARLVGFGMPYTKIGGIKWFDVVEVYRWMDKFHRTGTAGVKRVRGLRVKAQSK